MPRTLDYYRHLALPESKFENHIFIHVTEVARHVFESHYFNSPHLLIHLFHSLKFDDHCIQANYHFVTISEN